MTWFRSLWLLVLLAATSPAAAQAVSLSALATNPVRYDHRTVTVTGTVGLVEGSGASQSFTLIDGGVAVRVLPPLGGERVDPAQIAALVDIEMRGELDEALHRPYQRVLGGAR